MRLMLFLPLAILTPWLSGCAATTSDPAALPSPCRAIGLTEYTPAQRARLGAELDAAAGDGDIWPVFVREDVALRAAVRACSHG